MPIQHILLAILVTAVWGCNFIFAKFGVHEVPPLFLCAIRFLIASVPAIFLVPFPKKSMPLIGLYGLVMFAMQFSFMFIGIALGMAAGMATLLSQTTVFFSIMFASLFIRETPTRWQILGALVSFFGVALAARHLNHTNMPLSGFLFVLAGAVSAGFGNLITRKLGHVNTATLISWGCFIAFPPLLLLSFLVEGTHQIVYSLHHVTWLGITSLAYMVYISTWVGYGTWSWLLGRYAVSTVVPFSLLIPVFAMICATVFLHETLEPWKLNVALLVILGLCVNLFVPRLILQIKGSKPALDDLPEENKA